VLITAVQIGVPRVVLVRMLLTAFIDVAVGVIPVAGDLFDVAWKASKWNLALLERHANRPQPPSRGDWWFVGLVLTCLLVMAAAPVVALALLVRWLGWSLV
jgi:hypothetical protein